MSTHLTQRDLTRFLGRRGGGVAEAMVKQPGMGLAEKLNGSRARGIMGQRFEIKGLVLWLRGPRAPGLLLLQLPGHPCSSGRHFELGAQPGVRPPWWRAAGLLFPRHSRGDGVHGTSPPFF